MIDEKRINDDQHGKKRTVVYTNCSSRDEVFEMIELNKVDEISNGFYSLLYF